MNKYNIVLLPALISFLIIGCAKDEPQAVSDAELIQEIIDYNNKIEVNMEDLPSNAISLMENEYLVEYLHLYSLEASSLGYEVSLAGRTGAMGDRSEIYFDINGRKLDPNNTNNNKRDWYDGSGGFEGDRVRDNWKCFQIEYPYIIQMPNGATYTIESEDDSDFEEIKNYYEQNSGMDERPFIVFPINITTNDGESVTINNEDDMKEAYRDCSRRDRDWVEDKECFVLVYPVTYIVPDGTTFEVVSDDEAGWDALKAWYEANPDSEAMPTLSYPVSITYRNEEGEDIVIINNEEEMYTAKEECREMWDEEDKECFALVYPVTYIVPDGTTFEVVSDDEAGWDALKAWYEANPDSEAMPTLSYPVSITYRNEEGEDIVIINNEEEMYTAKEECREMWDEEEDEWDEEEDEWDEEEDEWDEEEDEWDEEEDEWDEECYSFVYPITFIVSDGSSFVINSEEDESGWYAIRRWYEENPNTADEEPSLSYPVDVITWDNEESVTTTITNSEELESFEQNNCG